jgi:hypothetical protein
VSIKRKREKRDAETYIDNAMKAFTEKKLYPKLKTKHVPGTKKGFNKMVQKIK